MTKRNYKGRFEGKPTATKRKGNLMNFSLYNKFWVAIVGAALTTLSSFTGIDTIALGITPEAVVSFITAVLVYAVPNTR